MKSAFLHGKQAVCIDCVLLAASQNLYFKGVTDHVNCNDGEQSEPCSRAGGRLIDPEIAETYTSLEARILAQALENVEIAEQRLREIQKLVGDFEEVLV